MKNLRGIVVALVALTVAGCAGGVDSVGPATMAPTVDITGKWVGTWVATSQALGSGAIEMTLKQAESKYTGNLTITGTLTDPSGFTQGVVSGNEVRVLQPTSLTGRLTVQGDKMTGLLQGVVAANVTLTRQK